LSGGDKSRLCLQHMYAGGRAYRRDYFHLSHLSFLMAHNHHPMWGCSMSNSPHITVTHKDLALLSSADPNLFAAEEEIIVFAWDHRINRKRNVFTKNNNTCHAFDLFLWCRRTTPQQPRIFNFLSSPDNSRRGVSFPACLASLLRARAKGKREACLKTPHKVFVYNSSPDFLWAQQQKPLLDHHVREKELRQTIASTLDGWNFRSQQTFHPHEIR
jgi:hypothetical protein